MVIDLSKRKINETKGILDKTFGMLLKKNKNGIILKTKFGIHTLFMKETIDVLVLDKENKVVGIKEDLKPYSFFFWNVRYDMVIELPAGSIKKENISLGDKLNF